ncbi:hypothetical protein, partial [Salipiger thiooxidans]|uniref:hypothetical protein n=1 Tax=Salipiger thiooxidans TaxID=282683 RepID=UPI001CF9DFAF
NRELVEQSALRFLPGPHHRRSPQAAATRLNQRSALQTSGVFQHNRLIVLKKVGARLKTSVLTEHPPATVPLSKLGFPKGLLRGYCSKFFGDLSVEEFFITIGPEADFSLRPRGTSAVPRLIWPFS